MRLIFRSLVLILIIFGYIGTAQTIHSIATDQACYIPGDTVRFSLSITDNTNGNQLGISYHHLFDIIDSLTIPIESDTMKWEWIPPTDDFKGYLVDVKLIINNTIDGHSSIAVDISSDWRRFPRYGFLSEYPHMTIEEQENIINRLARHHINGIQFYDWHWKHHRPLCGTITSPAYTWDDIALRKIYRDTVIRYITLAHTKNINAMAYNLLYGAYENAANDGVQNEWRLFQDSNHQTPDKHDLPDSWASDIYLINPANTIWQNYIINEMNKAFQAFDFDGWHIDQLGYRGTSYDYDGNTIDLKNSFLGFIEKVKIDLNKLLVFNAVDQYGQAQIATAPVDFLYTEVWSETSYRGLASVITVNNYYSGNQQKSVLAAYVNKGISGSSGTVNTPAVLLADAVIFANGASHLELGEHYLSNEYFPNNNLSITDDLKDRLITYYDFAVAYENLLYDSKESIPFSILSETDIKLSKTAEKDRIWVLNRIHHNQQIYHFINFIGVNTMDWRDPDGIQKTPELITDLPLIIKMDSIVTRLWMATPDTNQCSPIELDFTQSGDSLILSLPFLEYWTMLVLEFNHGQSNVAMTTSMLPQQANLGQNYPNPCNAETTIPFEIVISGKYIVKIVNLVGQIVYSNTTEYRPGCQNLIINLTQLSSGVYVYTLSGDSDSKYRKMLVIK